MNSKTIVIITAVIIFIAAIGILLNLETLSSAENKTPLEEKPVSGLPTPSLQNKSIPENISYSILKSKYMTTYSLPNGTGPNGILVDTSNLVWTSGSSFHSLFRLDFENNKMKSYPIPEEKRGQTMVWSMVEDKDGNIWFSQLGQNPLWRFNPITEKFSLFHTSSPPFQMRIENATGDIWFTTLTGNTIGVIQKTENKTEPSYKITEFPTGQDTDPSGLFLKDGSIWVAELGKGKIVRFDVLRNNDGGLVNRIIDALEIPPGKNRFSSPTDVLASNNQTIWITEHGSSTISEYNLTTDSWKRFSTAQTSHPIQTLPFWMRESLDNKGIWFNEHQGNRIAFLNTTDDALTEFEIPNNQPPELSPYMINNPIAPQNIASQNAYYSTIFTLNLSLDPMDSNRLWFSQWDNDKVGVVDRTITLPFDIHPDHTKTILLNNDTMQKAKIYVEISGDNILSNQMGQNAVFLGASSSMMPDGGFEKITTNFTVNFVDLSKVNQSVPVQLELQNEGAKAGNYTLGISAGNGLVTKTIFFDLEIQ